MKKRILLLTTGGTIASQDGGNGLAPVLSSDDFLDYMKEFEDVCELVPYEVCSIDSTNMEASWWLKLAGLIQKNYTLYDAFLICHGTDTMAYTAAALSYLIQNSVKPIVLTGAQKSILQEITDARKNLHDSIRCALDDRSRDVMLVFDGKIIAGTRAKKTATFSYNAFSSINFPVLGQIHDNTVVYYIQKDICGPVRFFNRMDRKVFLLKLTPGMSTEIIPHILSVYDCIIIEGFGVGGASLLDGSLEQPHNGVGLSRVAVHVDIVDLLEVLVDLDTVGQVGVELDNRSHAVCGCAQVRDEGRIGEAVCLGNDHLGLVVLLLQGLDEQSSVADVRVAQDGIGISLLQSQHLRGQVGGVGAVVNLSHNIQTVVGCKQVDAADQLLTDGSLIGEDGDLLDLVAGLLLGVLQILQHIFHVDGVQRAQTEEVIVVLVVLVGQTVQGGDSGGRF
mgnify:CR=1 FL=1